MQPEIWSLASNLRRLVSLVCTVIHTKMSMAQPCRDMSSGWDPKPTSSLSGPMFASAEPTQPTEGIGETGTGCIRTDARVGECMIEVVQRLVDKMGMVGKKGNRAFRIVANARAQSLHHGGVSDRIGK
jgi:hypothetical protein